MQVVPLDNSVIFKKLFRDPEILSAFFEDLTGIRLNLKPEHIELEKKFTPPVGLIDIEFDIFAEDPQRRIIVEIQRIHYDNLLDRFIHYHFAAIMEMQRSYREYIPSRTVYTVIWLTSKASEPPFNQGVSRSHFQFESTNGTRSAEYPHRIYIVNPNYLDQSVPPPLSDWLKLVYESIKNPDDPEVNRERGIMEKALSLIAEEKITPTERAKIMDEKDYMRVRQRDKNEGAETERNRLALEMLARGIDAAMVADICKMSEKEVQDLLSASTPSA